MALPPPVATGPQPVHPDEGFSGSGLAALAVGAGAASGFIRTGETRLWDRYLQGIRTVEAGFPAGILRTFRVSEALSPLETWSKISVPQSDFKAAGAYRDYLRHIFGDVKDIELRRMGRSAFGEIYSGGRLVGYGMPIAGGTQQGTAIADYFARVAGMDLPGTASLNMDLLRARYAASGTKIPFEEWLLTVNEGRSARLILGTQLREEANILGRKILLTGKQQRLLAKARLLSDFGRARAASTAGRLNVLLSKPFDLPIIGPALSKIPLVRSMAVPPTTHMGMVKGLVKKGIAAGLAWHGLEYYDYLRAQGSPMALPVGMAGGAAIGGFLFKGAGRMFSPAGLALGATAGALTGILPRFEHGLFHGVMSIGADVNLARAAVSEKLGITESLKEQEAVTPGLVSLKTMIGFGGVGALIGGMGDYASFLGKAVKTRATEGGVLANIFDELRYAKKMRMEKFWADSKIGQGLTKIPLLGKHLPKLKHPMALGFAAGIAAWGATSTALSLLSGNLLAAIPGVNLLGTEETPEELQAIYSGEEEIPVRKGRWWEMGRSSAYEGGRIQYYRKHALARLKARAFEKGLYGDESERWEYDPILHPFKALFGSDEWKYRYEIEHQYDRPAPMTGTYFEDVPFVGPLLAETVGTAIKPRKLVRPEEWILGGGEFVHRPDIREETEPAYELGGLGPGAPVVPGEGTQLFNELLYRRREAIGLPGFVEGALQKATTGREEVFQNLQTIETMGKETGAEYWLWKHMNLGGAALMSEPARRFIPRTRSYLDYYNPLRNDLPSWMPQDYFLDLAYGSPYSKIPEAEIRLPGPGYSSLYPEVEGVSPEQYPLVHRLKILSDVAMWSPEFKEHMALANRMQPQMSPRHQAMLKTIKEQVRQKKIRKEFQEYRFGDTLEQMDVTVSEVIDPRTIRAAELGDMNIQLMGIGRVKDRQRAMEVMQGLVGETINLQVPALQAQRYDVLQSGPRMKALAMSGGVDFGMAMESMGIAEAGELEGEFAAGRFGRRERLAGRAWEVLAHGAETPLEYLTPMSPAAKFIRQRSAIEDYIASEAVGTQASFWDKPFENFISPAMEMAEYKFGDTSIPESVQQRRDITEYFDMLKWVKEFKLENQAMAEGDAREAAQHRRERTTRTTFGVDVFGSPTAIMTALPRRERDYFASFINATTAEDRAKILSLVPETERRIYAGQWLRQEEEAIRAKRQADIATEEDLEKYAEIESARRGEGFAYSDEMEQQYYEETQGKYPFDEWLRLKKAQQYFSTHSLPGPDWLGWHSSADLEDIKMKYVETVGQDYHDFDLWDARKRALARKPYIDDQLISQMNMWSSLEDVIKVNNQANSFGKFLRASSSDVTMHRVNGNIGNGYDIEIRDGRRGLIEDAYKRLGA